jgi:hypothetical protein
MSAAKAIPVPTGPQTLHPISQGPFRLCPNELSPLESALPQIKIHHSANPIESIPFFKFAQFRTKHAPVTPVSTILTDTTPCNPSRMNTSAKHQVAPNVTSPLTNYFSLTYAKHNTSRSYHFPHFTSHQSPTTRRRRFQPIRSLSYTGGGGEKGPVTFPAFKAGDSFLRGSNGGFDSHTPPPTYSVCVGRGTPPGTPFVGLCGRILWSSYMSSI